MSTESHHVFLAPKTVADKRKSLSYKFGEKCCGFGGIFVGIVIFCATFFIIGFVYRKLYVSCPAPYGEECNNAGTCVNGVCICEKPYSGNACTDTQIPGFIVDGNIQCNGRGFVNPFIYPAPFCMDVIEYGRKVNRIKINGVVYQTGWNSPNCTYWVNSVRRLIERVGNPSLVIQSATIPLCVCDVGYGGTDCQKELCPADETGTICGGRGNKTVGLLSNYTTSGVGCQCQYPLSLNDPRVQAVFSLEERVRINKRYKKQFDQIYCGQLYQVNVRSNETVLIVYTPPNAYKCFCAAPFAGPVCKSNACEFNPSNGKICYGRGHRKLGQNYLPNTTLSEYLGEQCDILCIDGYEACPTNKCSLDQSQAAPLFDSLAFCQNPYICPPDSPLRCMDGTCVPFPLINDHGCINGFIDGSIDHGQLMIPIAQWICNNVTSEQTFTECFLNTTEIDGVLSYDFTGGIYLDTVLNYTFTFTTPLVYFQFITNATYTQIANWDGQIFETTDTGLISGVFDYSVQNQGDWIVVDTNASIVMTNTSSDLYSLCPMPWNYTETENFPSNYSLIRITSSANALKYVVRPLNSYVNLLSYANESYVIVFSNDSVITPLYLHPIGLIVESSTCLANPAQCSWYIDRVTGQARSLSSEFFVCLNSGLPEISDTPCTTPFVNFYESVSGYFFYWETCIFVEPLIPVTIQNQTFNVFERNYTERNEYSFVVTFEGLNGDNITFINDVVFLTLDRITVPCACRPTPYAVNESELNQIWYDEETIRVVRYDQITVGDYVLGATFDTGIRRFVRGAIAAYDEVAGVINVVNEIYLTNDEIYDENIRTIGVGEFLQGTSDADPMIYPFRCPDGSKTTASVNVTLVNVTCNCTLLNPVYNCSCLDYLYYQWGCSCSSITGNCICGLPATSEFESDLWNKLLQNTMKNCQTAITDILPTYENVTDKEGLVVNNETVYFEFDSSQIPTHIVLIERDRNCSDASFNLTAGSIYFLNVTVPFSVASSNNGTCEYWLTLFLPAGPAFTFIELQSSNISIYEAHIVFSIRGFLLTAIAQEFVYTASSNADQAENVNLLGSQYWLSSGSLNEIPTYIQVQFASPLYINIAVATFYQIGSNSLPNRVYLQGYTNSSWYTLGSISAFVEPGGWGTYTMTFNTTFSFIAFRMISPAGQFGLRQWSLYSTQLSACEDGSILVLSIPDLSGLKTISVLLEEVEFHHKYIDQLQCFQRDECNITVAGLVKDVSNNGQCEDLLYVASIAAIPADLNFVGSGFTNPRLQLGGELNYTETLITVDVLPGISSVQFANNESFFLNDTEQFFFFDQYLTGNYFPALLSNETVPTINSTIYYYYTVNSSVIIFNETIFQKTFYLANTTTFQIDIYEYNFGDLVTNGIACPTGFDVTDCGPMRTFPLMKGFQCALSYAQASLVSLIQNGTMFVNNTYYVSNLTSITTPWSAFFGNIPLTRSVPVLTLDNCPGQVCTPETPYKCLNGECVKYPSSCRNRYDCPGNGCVEQTDALSDGFKNYRCACALHAAGDACQFTTCVGATPYLIDGIPGSETCKCGGDDPFREKPPIVNYGGVIDNAAIVLINNRVTGNSVPKSATDVDYHRVMPIAAPWGRVLVRKVVLQGSDTLSSQQKTIYTDCPCIRKGFNGEHYYLNDDVIERDPLYGTVLIWRTYVNPRTNAFVRFIWANICSYDDFPYRCKNGQCVGYQSQCAKSEILFPLCNNRGTCMADSTCLCSPPYKTWSITEAYTQTISVPYLTINGVTQPTAWIRNYNSLHHGLNQCTAIDCKVANCKAPVACFPGTPSLNFEDAEVLCPESSGRNNRCAPSISDCFNGFNLTIPLKCAGKGIPRIKDFTSGEEYCFCGEPEVENVNITSISQITQLKNKGWGGPACDQRFAVARPIVWSEWNWEVNQPYRSAVTGRDLPGIWVSGKSIAGPNPDNPKVKQCCIGYERLEDCPFIPCSIQGDVVCEESAVCENPLVEICNGHGVATAGETCDCETSQETGVGYTFDLTQFSYKGCYKRIECPLSQINGESCRNVNPCTSPGEFRYPMEYDLGLEDQWYSCMGGRGLYNNLTLLNVISSSTDEFQQKALQGVSRIALDVIAAEVGLGTCQCDYPNDTVTEKFGMLPGTPNRYFEGFKSPRYLWGSFPLYPLLTDGTLEDTGPDEYVYSAGDSFDYYLSDNQTTYISAILIFGATTTLTTRVQFTSSLGTVCTPVNLEITAPSPYRDWITSNNTAHYCGPTYTCFDFASEADYASNCQIISSIQCIEWKKTVCTNTNLAVNWPLNSLDVYQGCDRFQFSDVDPCTCCVVTIFAGLNPVVDGKITFSVDSGIFAANQIQIYGYGLKANVAPAGLQSRIASRLGSNLDALQCQDYPFYSEYLGDDKTPYAPPNAVSATFAQSFNICNNTGGVIAVTDNIINQADIRLLQRTCALNVNNNPVCWVSARDALYNERYVLRSQIFQPGCTLCFSASRLVNNYIIQSFSTFPGPPTGITTANYRLPIFGSQINGFENLLTFSSIINNRFTVGKVYTPQIPPCSVNYVIFTETEAITVVHQLYTTEAWTTSYYIQPVVRTRFVFIDKAKGETDTITDVYQWNYVYTNPRQCANINFMPDEACGVGLPPNQADTIKRQPINFPYAPVYTLDNGYDPDAMNPKFDRCWDASKPGKPNDLLGGSRYALCQTTVRNCVRYTPYFGPNRASRFYEITIDPSKNTIADRGVYGVDFVAGLQDHPYLPVFMNVAYTRVYSVTWYEDNDKVYPSAPLLSDSTPVYLTKTIGGNSVTWTDITETWTVWPNLYSCEACYLNLAPNLRWLDYTYHENTWPGTFSAGIYNDIYIKTDESYTLLKNETVPVFVHQTTYIVNEDDQAARNLLSPNPSALIWRFSSCVAVGSRGFVLKVCDDQKLNVVCKNDFTQFTVPAGRQCPECGDSSRTGGDPTPGLTCYDSFPLANATKYPVEHQIRFNYQQGTLDLWVDRFNLPADLISFENISVIFAIPEAWAAWEQDLSTRPGKSTRGVRTEQNWCDMSISLNWPVYCGVQRLPTDNSIVQYCASNAVYCSVLFNENDNALVPESETPPVYGPVDPEISKSSPSCGYIVDLMGYFRVDKIGGIQDSLDINSTILRLDRDFVNIQFNSINGSVWFNSGKSNTRYVFEANTTSTISGRYILTGCGSCVNPIMEVFIYPLNPNYTFPVVTLSQYVLMNTDSETAYEVDFSLTTANTGSVTISGTEFPLYVFRGVGFRFINVVEAASVVIYNPVITNEETREFCETRNLTRIHEPKVRIRSTAEFQKCILTEDDLILFPGGNLGECACALASAGAACDFPAVTFNGRKSVCGGYGDSEKAVIGYDGNQYITGSGVNEGGFIIQGTSECKTIDIGRAAYTLVTPGAIWDYVYVSIDTPPLSGAGVFINPFNALSLYLTYDEIDIECQAEGAYLPFYFTGDELNQLARSNLGRGAVIMGTITPESDDTIPWIPAAKGSYFINGIAADFVSNVQDLDCTAEPDLCVAVNYNNLVYGVVTGSNAFVTNGNAYIQSTTTAAVTILTWNQNAVMQVKVYVFGQQTPSSVNVDCYNGGTCGSAVVVNSFLLYKICRCPARQIQIPASSTLAEVQVFDEEDQTEVPVYDYN